MTCCRSNFACSTKFCFSLILRFSLERREKPTFKNGHTRNNTYFSFALSRSNLLAYLRLAPSSQVSRSCHACDCFHVKKRFVRASKFGRSFDPTSFSGEARYYIILLPSRKNVKNFQTKSNTFHLPHPGENRCGFPVHYVSGVGAGAEWWVECPPPIEPPMRQSAFCLGEPSCPFGTPKSGIPTVV